MTQGSKEKERVRRALRYAKDRGRILRQVAAYHVANRSKILERVAAHRIAHVEQARMRDALRYAANPEKKRTRDAARRAVNTEEVREKDRARAAARRALESSCSVGAVTVADVRAIFAETGGTCIYCGDVATELDHLFPLSRGGPHAIHNLAPACRSCNASKHNKLPGEWKGRPTVPQSVSSLPLPAGKTKP